MSAKEKGKMIVVTAPSGAGKTTIVRHLLSQYDEMDFSVSATTREKREHEEEGKDYYFLSKEAFKEKIALNEFVEWEEVYEGKFYGTLKSEIKRLWEEGYYILFDIDVKGATSLKNLYKDQCLTIFIEPPSLNVLIERLKNRNTETPASLKQRVNRIKNELGYSGNFDTSIINDVLEVALKEAELKVEAFLGIDNK